MLFDMAEESARLQRKPETPDEDRRDHLIE
jgi:hypothetical protein